MESIENISPNFISSYKICYIDGEIFSSSDKFFCWLEKICRINIFFQYIEKILKICFVFMFEDSVEFLKKIEKEVKIIFF